jgi:hypothetical protein
VRSRNAIEVIDLNFMIKASLSGYVFRLGGR